MLEGLGTELSDSGYDYAVARKEEQVQRFISRLTHEEGLTSGKAEHVAPDLLKSLGITDGQALCDLIHRILDAMPQDKFTRALRNAFGGEAQPELLGARRELFAEQHGVTTQTVTTWERVAVAKMADKLLVLMDAHAAEKPKGQIALAEALLSLERAVREQTSVLRDISEQLKHLSS